MNNINKSVICIILVIIFIAVFIGLRNSFAEKTNTVEIIQDGKIIYTLDLDESKDKLIEVDFQGHKNIIQIKDKQISIIEADCPDKTCVNMGILKSAFTKCERKAPKFIYGDISSLKNNDSISLFFIVLYF